MFKDLGLCDVEPREFVLTWRNMRRGRISVLQLDSFKEAKTDLEEENKTKYLVWGGDLDHLPIFLKIEKEDKKPHGPFKFKQSLLEEDGFKLQWRLEGVITILCEYKNYSKWCPLICVEIEASNTLWKHMIKIYLQ